MKTRLLKKLRKQAKNKISLRPLYGDRIGIYFRDRADWFMYNVASGSYVRFERIEDALPTLQRLRDEYVSELTSRMKSEKLKRELEKY